MSWLARLLVVALFFVALLGRSGGGLGPSTVCGSLEGLYVAATWITLLALPVLFVIAVTSNLSKHLRTAQPAIPDAPLPPYGEPAAAASPPRQPRSLAARLLPPSLVAGGLIFVLFGPSGCAPFHVCGRADAVPSVPTTELHFTGELPLAVAGGSYGDLSAYTATFDVKGRWELSWNTSADRARVDVFTAEAIQTGRYFPEAGHTFVGDSRPSGSTTVEDGGSFCVRIELRDENYERAASSYYSATTRPNGPTPTPRRMSWEISIARR